MAKILHGMLAVVVIGTFGLQVGAQERPPAPERVRFVPADSGLSETSIRISVRDHQTGDPLPALVCIGNAGRTWVVTNTDGEVVVSNLPQTDVPVRVMSAGHDTESLTFFPGRRMRAQAAVRLAPNPKASSDPSCVPSRDRREEATRMVLQAFYNEAAHAVARASIEAGSTAWTFDLPSDDRIADWGLIRRELESALSAREARDDDTSIKVIRVSDVRATADSLAFTLAVGGRFRCPSGWRGSSSASRYELEWAKLRAVVRYTDFSDSAGCPR